MSRAAPAPAPPAAILAGGRATRMGGGDKPLMTLAGRPLLDHVIERLSPQAAAIAINANGDPARFARWGLPVIADEADDRPGPLAGVLAAMDWAAASGAAEVLTVAGDTPFFPADLAARLAEARERDGAPIALAATPDPARGLGRHPTFGLWPTALREDLRGALAEGLRKVVAWTDRHGVAHAVFDVAPFDPFFNVNTPDDMAAAEGIARELGL